MAKKLLSEERSTGMGADRFSAVLTDDGFVRVSRLPGAVFEGRDRGVNTYSLVLPNGAVTASFYRSNRGNESVVIDAGTGQEIRFDSFAAADVWAKKRLGILPLHCCPCCGRDLTS